MNVALHENMNIPFKTDFNPLWGWRQFRTRVVSSLEQKIDTPNLFSSRQECFDLFHYAAHSYIALSFENSEF